MAESETLSVDTSTENQEDPLQDLTDEQIYQLLEETMWVYTWSKGLDLKV